MMSAQEAFEVDLGYNLVLVPWIKTWYGEFNVDLERQNKHKKWMIFQCDLKFETLDHQSACAALQATN